MKVHTVMLSLGMAILAVGLLTAAPRADSEPAEPNVDWMLEQALVHPQSFMLVDHVTSRADSNADLVITSARGPNGESAKAYVRPGSMRVFRADTERDEFARQGGWHWRCGEVEGRTRFETRPAPLIDPPTGAGPLVLVVRQLDGTIHWYALAIDFRC